MGAMIPVQGIGCAQVQGAGGEAETVAVPASALRLFLHLLTEMSQGNAVTLVPTHEEWTTQLTGDGIDCTGYQTQRPRCRHVPIIRPPFAAGFQSGPMRPGRRGAPLEGTVIRRLGNTDRRSAVELHAPAFSPAGDALARLRRVQVERQEEKPAVERHGDPPPRTHADKQSAVTLLLASVNG